jgi:hypothetical protein
MIGEEKSWLKDALEYLATPKDMRVPKKVVDFCEQKGIKRGDFYYECQKDDFQEKLLKKMILNIKDDAPEIFDKLAQNAKAGSEKAIELFLKYIMKIAEKFDLGTDDKMWNKLAEIEKKINDKE